MKRLTPSQRIDVLEVLYHTIGTILDMWEEQAERDVEIGRNYGEMMDFIYRNAAREDEDLYYAANPAPQGFAAEPEPTPESTPEPTQEPAHATPTVEQLQSYLANAVPVLGGQTIYQVICGAIPSGKITDLDDQGRLDVALSIAAKLEEVQG